MVIKSTQKKVIETIKNELQKKYPKQDIYLWKELKEVEFWSIHNGNAIRYDVNEKTWYSTMLKDRWVTEFCQLLPR